MFSFVFALPCPARVSLVVVAVAADAVAVKSPPVYAACVTVQMLVSMVGSSLKLLNNLQELIPALTQLGLRHNAYKVCTSKHDTWRGGDAACSINTSGNVREITLAQKSGGASRDGMVDERPKSFPLQEGALALAATASSFKGSTMHASVCPPVLSLGVCGRSLPDVYEGTKICLDPAPPVL